MEDRKLEIIEKVQKCLLLSKDESTSEGERDAAKRRAALLMAKYRIEETEVDLDQHNFVYDVHEYYWDAGHKLQWAGRIASLFCWVFDTKMVFRDFSISEYTEFEIFGTFSDVETVLYFIEVATHHIEQACTKKWPKERNWKKRQAMGNIAVDALWQRAWELKEQMDQTIHEEEGCTALVVKKTDQISKDIEEMYPDLKKARNKKIDRDCDLATAQAGIEAGKTCPLNFAVEE